MAATRNRFLKDWPDGTINTVAGNGSTRIPGDGGPALAAAIAPNGIVVDAKGNLYIGDTAGVITTIARRGQMGYAGDNGPAINSLIGLTGGIALDTNSNVYSPTSRTPLFAKSIPQA